MLTEIRTTADMPLAPERPTADVDKQFQAIAKNYRADANASTVTSTAKKPDKDRITVLLDLPHLKQYGYDPTRELVYGCTFAVSVGDLVSCPPTPRHGRWTTGIVVALDGGHYRGRVKQVRKVKAAAQPSKPESESTS
jgi:hypothetical protein